MGATPAPPRHTFVEHTGELAIEILAPTQAGVFEQALVAFAEIVAASPADGETESYPLELAAAEPSLLLVAWLEELVFLAEVEQLVPERVEGLELDGTRLRATVVGRRGHPRHLVKAVTLHDLELADEGGSWRARLVLDV
jgi:SHS2 domain-containing protein